MNRKSKYEKGFIGVTKMNTVTPEIAAYFCRDLQSIKTLNTNKKKLKSKVDKLIKKYSFEKVLHNFLVEEEVSRDIESNTKMPYRFYRPNSYKLIIKDKQSAEKWTEINEAKNFFHMTPLQKAAYVHKKKEKSND